MRFEILELNIHIYHTMQINLCIYKYNIYKYTVYWAVMAFCCLGLTCRFKPKKFEQQSPVTSTMFHAFHVLNQRAAKQKPLVSYGHWCHLSLESVSFVAWWGSCTRRFFPLISCFSYFRLSKIGLQGSFEACSHKFQGDYNVTILLPLLHETFLSSRIICSMRASLETYHDRNLSILSMTEASGHRSGFSKVENNGATKKNPLLLSITLVGL